MSTNAQNAVCVVRQRPIFEVFFAIRVHRPRDLRVYCLKVVAASDALASFLAASVARAGDEVSGRSVIWKTMGCDTLAPMGIPIVRKPSIFFLGTLVALSTAMRSSPASPAVTRPRGFTLLEILVVIALISLLTTGVAVGATRMLEKAKIEQAKTDTANLASVAEAFLVAKGNEACPTVEELRRDGVLSRRAKTEDPWGTPYRIQCEPSYAIAISASPDSTFETADDVKSEP